MIRLRPEQLDAFRKECREALADRLAKRCAARFPEKTLGRDAAEVRAEAGRLAAEARVWGLVSEEDVTLFYDLSIDLGPGFEKGAGGRWAREILESRTLSPHERIVALRERVLREDGWDPFRARARRELTARVSRTVAKGPPRRLETLRKRRAELKEIEGRLRAARGPEPGPKSTSGRETLLQQVYEAWCGVQTEHALRLDLELLTEKARAKASVHRSETDPAKKKRLEQEIEVLSVRFERTKRILQGHLAESAPPTGSADAEDPCIARIENDRISDREAIRAEAERKLTVARDLCDARGAADEGDRIVAAVELGRMPGEALEQLRRSGTRVVVCRGSVTDHRKDLAGSRPRGWPPDAGWSGVPGHFDGTRNEVVLATRGHEPRRSGRVPERGDGHGSENLAIHVAHHALDEKCGNPSAASAFKTARSADLEKLPDYCRQPGAAGLDESWAESAARFFADPEKMESDLPNLHRYWRGSPGGRTDRADRRTVVKEDWEVRSTRMQRRSSIGSACLDENGAIILDQRASDGRGILGDARLVYPRSHPQYPEILDHLGGLIPGETKPVPPWPAQR